MISILDKRVLEAIEKNVLTVNAEDHEGCIALDLAVKRAVNEKIILALAKYCLPFDPETLQPISSKNHQYAWIKFIHRDTNAKSVELILNEYPQLVYLGYWYEIVGFW